MVHGTWLQLQGMTQHVPVDHMSQHVKSIFFLMQMLQLRCVPTCAAGVAQPVPVTTSGDLDEILNTDI
jgi:hypothetical protein